MLEEIEIEHEIDSLNKKIQEYERYIKEIESSKRLKFLNSKDLKKFKSELSECIIKKQQLLKKLEPYNLERKKIRLERKKVLCQDLISEVLKTEKIYDNENKSIIISPELKMSFIEEIKKFMESSTFIYNYYYEETENYSISEGLVLENDDKVNLLVTTNDYPIAAKKHTHYRTVSEMLIKYMEYCNQKMQNSKKHMN